EPTAEGYCRRTDLRTRVDGERPGASRAASSAARRPPVSPDAQAPGDLGLVAPLRRFVVAPVPQLLRKMFLVAHRLRMIVRVVVSGAVAESLHERGRRVAQVEGDREGAVR